MSDEDETVKILEGILTGEDINSALQKVFNIIGKDRFDQCIRKIDQSVKTAFIDRTRQTSDQDASATQEGQESVNMNEAVSSVQRRDDDTQSGQNQADRDIGSVIMSILMQKMIEMEHRLRQSIQIEVQTALNKELPKYREGFESEQIIVEEVESDNDLQLQTVQGATISRSDLIKYWQIVAKEEWLSARKTDLRASTGIFTVICLDTSGSMKEQGAWDQAKIFYTEYLNGLKDLNDGNNTIDKVALVVFGTETKVCLRFTSDFDSLKLEFDKLKPDGHSPMFGGFVLSIAETEISDMRYPNSSIKIWPKIILITDGRPTPVEDMDGSEENCDNAQETKDLILKEAVRLRKERIELNIVYVGKADYDFLHQLREGSSGIMMPYTDGQKTAQCNLVKFIVKSSKKKKTNKNEADSLEGTGKSEADGMLVYSKTLVKLTKVISKMLAMTGGKYTTLNDKRYPPIGSRVKRAKDWTWGEQDGNGVGTIIGHNPKEPNERQYWVWVEWDENEDANVYRFKGLPGTKNDVQIVQDERIPPDDCQIAVGMKVTTGKDYKGEKEQKEGVVIRFNYPDDPVNGSKAEVLWVDGTRAEYFFGDNGTKVEIEPRTVLDSPDEPRSLKVRSVSDTEVCLKWERPASCGGCSIKKYTVLRKSDHEDSEWLQTTEVDGSQTSATICDLLPKEKYKFSVRAENKIGFGTSAETESTVTLDLKPNRPQAPVGPVLFLDITKGSCKLSWQKSCDNSNEPITHYLIEYREKNGKWKSIHVGLITSYTISGLRKSTKYEVRIKAVNGNGESDPLGIVQFQTLTLLDHDIPDAELQDIHITELSQGIGQNWEMLGPHFNRENVEISRIKLDHPQSVVLQITSMLSKWKHEMGSQATLHAFLEGVEKFPTVDVNWDIIEKVARQFRNEAACK